MQGVHACAITFYLLRSQIKRRLLNFYHGARKRLPWILLPEIVECVFGDCCVCPVIAIRHHARRLLQADLEQLRLQNSAHYMPLTTFAIACQLTRIYCVATLR
jgi:hypothetical protein